MKRIEEHRQEEVENQDSNKRANERCGGSFTYAFSAARAVESLVATDDGNTRPEDA